MSAWFIGQTWFNWKSSVSLGPVDWKMGLNPTHYGSLETKRLKSSSSVLDLDSKSHGVLCISASPPPRAPRKTASDIKDYSFFIWFWDETAYLCTWMSEMEKYLLSFHFLSSAMKRARLAVHAPSTRYDKKKSSSDPFLNDVECHFARRARKNIEFVCKMPKIFLGLQDKAEERRFMIFYDLSYPFACWDGNPKGERLKAIFVGLLWLRLHRRLLKILKNFPSCRLFVARVIWIFLIIICFPWIPMHRLDMKTLSSTSRYFL